MPKQTISKRQKFRIKKLQEKRLSRAEKKLRALEDLVEQDDASLGPETKGLLIAHYSGSVDVESEQGKLYRCYLRRNLEALVAGDWVIFRPAKSASGVVVALCPRKSLLAKQQERDQIKPIAANINQIVIVIAPEPEPTLSLLDSYLIAAEAVKIPASILLNKIDLLTPTKRDELQRLLTIYSNLGYPVYTASIKKLQGLLLLKTALKDKANIFVGQSGVGKSSLINALVPGVNLPVGELSFSQHGIHTTTTSQLFHLPFGGDIIDSPGIREFALWHMSRTQIAHGFIEFRDFINYCKFKDCNHQNEPHCAVKQAVAEGKIAKERLESYYALLKSLPE